MIMERQITPAERSASLSALPPLETYLAAGRVRGIAWTSLRQEVLGLLWRDGRPWGAYGLADEMRKAGSGIYPTSLYRVLDLLEEAGLIVSITSSRRVQISPDPEQRDWAVLQCSWCEASELIPIGSEAAVVRQAACDCGHDTERLVIECVGRCRSCRAEESKHRREAAPQV